MRETEREIARLRRSLRRLSPDAGKRREAPAEAGEAAQSWTALYRQYSMRRDG